MSSHFETAVALGLDAGAGETASESSEASMSAIPSCAIVAPTRSAGGLLEAGVLAPRKSRSSSEPPVASGGWAAEEMKPAKSSSSPPNEGDGLVAAAGAAGAAGAADAKGSDAPNGSLPKSGDADCCRPASAGAAGLAPKPPKSSSALAAAWPTPEA